METPQEPRAPVGFGLTEPIPSWLRGLVRGVVDREWDTRDALLIGESVCYADSRQDGYNGG